MHLGKQISSLACCAVLAMALSAPAPAPALASSDTAKAIGAAIAIGILGAAVADHHREREYYVPHPVIGPDENAVGTCIHHADRIVRKAPGGLYARLDRVKAVKQRDNGRTAVKAVLTGVYQWGQKPSDVRCVVKNHRVVKFDYN